MFPPTILLYLPSDSFQEFPQIQVYRVIQCQGLLYSPKQVKKNENILTN